LEVHVNLLKIGAASYPPTPQTMGSTGHFFKVNQNPWLNVHVMVVKSGPHKGYQAVVKNILPGQTTFSKPRLEIQFLHLDPSSPFKRVIVDYDDVVETS
ncbi:hypothetical protein BYT27DRAFT_7077528, partial [Phlegmacium glaucopus]